MLLALIHKKKIKYKVDFNKGIKYNYEICPF